MGFNGVYITRTCLTLYIVVLPFIGVDRVDSGFGVHMIKYPVRVQINAIGYLRFIDSSYYRAWNKLQYFTVVVP